MKKLLFITIGLLTTLASYSQKLKTTVKAPKGWVYCPQGSYKMMVEGDWYAKERTISVTPFFISNEITNKEYRAFYNHIKQTPNDTLYWVDLKKADTRKSGYTAFIKKALHKDVFPELIDRAVWENDSSKKDYFFNPKYDNYPVVGVTYEGARFYCVWRTSTENKMLSQKGEPLIPDYRIPYEWEWAYAAGFKQETAKTFKNELHNVKKGEKNKLKIRNLQSNVAEWTATFDPKDKTLKVVRGGTYKGLKGTEFRELVKENKSKDYIGFRIVRTYEITTAY